MASGTFELLSPEVLEVLTTSVAIPSYQRAEINFVVSGGNCYACMMDKASLRRLGRQIERALEGKVGRRNKRKA